MTVLHSKQMLYEAGGCFKYIFVRIVFGKIKRINKDTLSYCVLVNLIVMMDLSSLTVNEIVVYFVAQYKMHAFEYMDFWISLKLLRRSTADCILILTRLYSTSTNTNTPDANRPNTKASRKKSPLHFAVKSGFSHEIVNFIIQSMDLSNWNLKDCDGKTPLHYAAIHADVKVIYAVGAWNPSSAVMFDTGGMTALHYAIKNNRKSSVILAVATIDSLSIRIKVNAPNAKRAKVTNGENVASTPLYLALLAKSEYKIVKFLYDEYPLAIGIKNSAGDYPIHDALENNSGHDVIDLLTAGVEYDLVHSLLCENSEGMLPIEVALKVSAQINTCVTLIHRTKQQIKRICDSGKSDHTMVDSASMSLSMRKKIEIAMYMIKYEVQEDIMDMYMNEFPNNGIVQTSSMTCSLLHFAAMMKSPVAILDKVYQKMPEESRTIFDTHGNTPLHYMFHNRYAALLLDGTVVPQLKLPASLSCVDMDTCTKTVGKYLEQETVGVPAVEYLVTKWKESVSIETCDGGVRWWKAQVLG